MLFFFIHTVSPLPVGSWDVCWVRLFINLLSCTYPGSGFTSSRQSWIFQASLFLATFSSSFCGIQRPNNGTIMVFNLPSVFWVYCGKPPKGWSHSHSVPESHQLTVSDASATLLPTRSTHNLRPIVIGWIYHGLNTGLVWYQQLQHLKCPDFSRYFGEVTH